MPPCLVMYFKWLLKVIKVQRLAKGTLCFPMVSSKGAEGTLGENRSDRGVHCNNRGVQHRSIERTLCITYTRAPRETVN